MGFRWIRQTVSRVGFSTALAVATTAPLFTSSVSAQSSVSSPFFPPGTDTQVMDNLALLPTIPIENFPTVVVTAEVIEQFAAAGTPLPDDLQLGQEIRPEDLFRIGHFEPFGLDEISLRRLAQQTETPLGSLSFADVESFLGVVTLDNLLQSGQFDRLANTEVADVPGVVAVLVQVVFDKWRLDETSDLRPLDQLLERKDGRLGALLRLFKDAAATATDATDLPEINIESVGAMFGTLRVGELVEVLPEVGTLPFDRLAPQQLQQLSLKRAIPGLTRLPIGSFDEVETLPLSSLSALRLASLSLGQMPDPMKLVGGVRFGLADVALGEPESGDAEQQRLRVVSGGIRSKNKKLTGVRCPGDACPHFEISTSSGGGYHGAAWMDGSTTVPDGFGLLCKPWGCKGPAGNHPFGSGVRVQLRNIDQASGTAQVSLSFAFCRRILFVGKTCTPWVFPIPSGIPIGVIREKTLVPFAPPRKVK